MRLARLAAVLVLVIGCNSNEKSPVRFTILVTPKDLLLQRFDSAQVQTAVVDAGGGTVGRVVTFQPQDPTLVAVSATGMVRSKGPVGSTRVFLQDPTDQVYDTLYVSVGTTLLRITLAPGDTAIALAGRIAYRVTGYDAYGSVPQPFTLSFSPDSGYLADSGSGIVRANGRPGEVVVTVQSGSVSGRAGVLITDTLTAGRLPAPGHPRWVAVSGAGRGFVTRSAAQFLTQYDAAARKPGASVVVPFGVSALAVDSAGDRLYAATSTVVLDIDPGTGVAVDTQFTGAQPLGVAVGPDGLTLWVSVVGDVLQIYDRVSGGLVKALSATAMTRFAASPAGDSLLYGMTSGAVVEINTRTDSVGRTFGGEGPSPISRCPRTALRSSRRMRGSSGSPSGA